MTGYPRYYAVNDRPVKLVECADGSVDALVLDLATGAFASDPAYFARISDTGPGKDVDQLQDEDAFDALVGAIRTQVPIAWSATGDGEFPYEAHVGAERWEIRVNDFPAEPLYTLRADGRDQLDLEDWPPAWTKPT